MTHERTMINCPGCARHGKAHHKSEDPNLVVVSNTFELFGLFEEWLKMKENETFPKSSDATYERAFPEIHIFTSVINTRERHLNGLDMVHVTACFGHYGHAISMAALPLSNEDEDVVKNLIEAGVSARTGVRGGSDLSRRRKRNRRHKDAISYYTHATQKYEYCWTVRGPRRESICQATIDYSDCSRDDGMNSHCERCGVCSYTVHCNCYDASQAGVSCVDVHAVKTFRARSQRLRQHLSALPAVKEPLRENSNNIENNNAVATEIHSNVFYPAPAVKECDKIKEALQEAEGLKNQFGELAKAYAKSNRLDLINQMNEFMKNGLGEMPQEALENRFVSRAVMQTTGAGTAPSRIQPQYKSRAQLRLEKKKKHYPYNYTDEDFE
ncbi:unnamed protein product [Cylicocyclus nassatus]|uniref:Uncharacterized protein n=1 Tax=Cylicocyclus nassatus TaxID=53992 RepID=A0AA36M576_CYLNA|nr:unnamed protein product [Cylicocyclus nassatus]